MYSDEVGDGVGIRQVVFMGDGESSGRQGTGKGGNDDRG